MPRDNFTQATKDLVAKRVAYRCCFKGCGIATIGPKYGDALNTSSVRSDAISMPLLQRVLAIIQI